MIKSYKIRLEPNNKQNTLLHKSSGIARFAYNWALAREQENYKQGNKFIQDGDLRKEFTLLRNNPAYLWLKEVSNDIPKQAIKDAVLAYKRFFKGQNKYPNFKKKRNSHQSFYQDNFKIQITETHAYLSNIGYVRFSEKGRLPVGKGKNKEISVINPRITFDGLNWYLSVGMECSVEVEELNGVVGIDLGIKDTAVLSNGVVIPNINKTNKIKKLEKRIKRLQKKIAKKYIKNKKGDHYIKTSNIAKLEKKANKIRKKITNIRTDFIHKSTTSIVKTKPSKIIMEDLNIKGMMKNHKLAKSIQDQSLSEFKRQLKYKCEWNGIELKLANRWFPSSKTCSCCGFIKPKLSLSERTFVCECCGFEIDRDLNAAINLKNYAA